MWVGVPKKVLWVGVPKKVYPRLCHEKPTTVPLFLFLLPFEPRPMFHICSRVLGLASVAFAIRLMVPSRGATEETASDARFTSDWANESADQLQLVREWLRKALLPYLYVSFCKSLAGPDEFDCYRIT